MSRRLVVFCLLLYDFAIVNSAYFLALWLRFDGKLAKIPSGYAGPWKKFTLIYAVFCLVVFVILRLYRNLWRFASYGELARILTASILTAIFHTVAITLLFRRMPLSYYIMGAFIQFVLIAGIRFLPRFLFLVGNRSKPGQRSDTKTRVMLVGAGSAGHMILRDINHSPDSDSRVCCIIDDDPSKWDCLIDSVPVVGGRDDILTAVKDYRIEKIFVALPSASPEERRDILDICKESGCALKNLPGVQQIITNEVTARDLRDVSVEDLLGRPPIQINTEEVFGYIHDRVILITGGGGSIGSELSRQVAAHGPRQLVLFDIYENNVYDLQQELRDSYPDLDLVVLIGSVRDGRRLRQVFSQYRPDVVYHAAAHKHVPLMEDSPCESVKNNVIGTYRTAYAAMLSGCKRFVLISTDKAVNPTNVMGASKRMCEMVIQTFGTMIFQGRAQELPRLFYPAGEQDQYPEPMNGAMTATEFVAVRFGNVLGSNGSVVPLFQKQIAKGGPVTVTHPDIVRYFMTIPEAASLVLQAGAYAKGGEIFVLDMGSPMKIDTLARNLIKLSGLIPDVDIKIEYTGLRPGEKLYEEKLMDEEGLQTTPNHLIHIGRPIEFDPIQFLAQLQELEDAAFNNQDGIQAAIQKIVPTYVPNKAGAEVAVSTTFDSK